MNKTETYLTVGLYFRDLDSQFQLFSIHDGHAHSVSTGAYLIINT